MAKKYKVTGCAKFFFVLLLLAPLAFIGASYYNGQNPFDTIKRVLGSERTVSAPQTDSETAKLRKDVNYYRTEMERLQQELDACQQARRGG